MVLDEIHDALNEKENKEHKIVGKIFPVKDATAETECDSDSSTDKVACDPNHLLRRILLTDIISPIEEQQINNCEKQQSTLLKLSDFFIKNIKY